MLRTLADPNKFKQITPAQIRYLLAVMVASALGSFATTAFLEVTTVSLHEGTWLIRCCSRPGRQSPRQFLNA